MDFVDNTDRDCSTCKLGKARRDSHKSSKNEVHRIGEVVSGDWIEKLQPGSNGETISLQLIDWYSRKAWTYQLTTKEHAMNYATYVRNLSPVAGLDNVPEHIWTGRRPDVSHLRIFGETCFPRIPNKDQKSKLLPRATTATFVGFDEQSRTYRCLDSITNGLILAPHVQFMKTPKLPTINLDPWNNGVKARSDRDTRYKYRQHHPSLRSSAEHVLYLQ